MSEAKQRLLGAMSLRPAPFSVPALADGVVLLRRWSAAERQEFQVRAREAGDSPMPDLYEQLFIRSVCDDSGTRLFAFSEIAEVRQLDGLALEQVALEVLKLNGLEGGAEKKALSPTTPN